ncbi:MAG: hypothetical protein HKN16_02235 [Saprospiraceae bacterium]|nr:hypothetical protein [Saprospiraceae bacterium]
MNYLYILGILIIIAFSCTPAAKKPPSALAEPSTQEVDGQPLGMKSPEQAAAELEELAYRKSMDFLLLFDDGIDRIYMEKNRISHFVRREDGSMKQIHKTLLADFDKIEALKKTTRDLGILELENEEVDSRAKQLSIKLDGTRRTFSLEKSDHKKLPKPIQAFIVNLKELSQSPQ